MELRWIALVAGLGLLVRLSLLTADSAITPGDGPVYFGLAHDILDGDGLSGNDFRTPGYPVAILPSVLIQRATGAGEADLLLAAQSLLGLLLAIVVLLVGARFFGTAVGVVAGILTAVSPVVIALERITYPDLMFAVAVFVGAALLAEGLVRDGERRRLILAGVTFGAAAYLKPVGQALLLAPLLALVVSTRSVRRSLFTGALAAAAMLLTLSPWLVHNALRGTFGMSNQGGLTLFHRAFDDDRYGVPTDIRYGPLLREEQERAPAQPSDRVWARAQQALRDRGLSTDEAYEVMGSAARTAIRRNAGTYVLRTGDDLRQTVADLADSSPDRIDGWDHERYLRQELDSARVPLPPADATWAVLKLGVLLNLGWLILTVHGLVALLLPFSPRDRTRDAGVAFLMTWLVLALTTSLTHGALWRYSASLAPLTWVAGTAGAAVLLAFLKDRLRGRRAAPLVPSASRRAERRTGR